MIFSRNLHVEMDLASIVEDTEQKGLCAEMGQTDEVKTVEIDVASIVSI